MKIALTQKAKFGIVDYVIGLGRRMNGFNFQPALIFDKFCNFSIARGR